MAKKPKRYDSGDDVHMRLHGTIVRYKDRPVKVVHDSSSTKVLVVDLFKPTDTLYIDANDEALDISSPPLGYINVGSLVYCARSPQRRQKQGMLPQEMFYHKDPAEWATNWGNYGGSNYDEAIGKCILNDYPEPDYVIKNIKSGFWKGGAVDRRLGFCNIQKSRLFEVRYMCSGLGVYLPQDKVVLVTEEVFNTNKTAVNALVEKNISIDVVKEASHDA